MQVQWRCKKCVTGTCQWADLNATTRYKAEDRSAFQSFLAFRRIALASLITTINPVSNNQHDAPPSSRSGPRLRSRLSHRGARHPPDRAPHLPRRSGLVLHGLPRRRQRLPNQCAPFIPFSPFPCQFPRNAQQNSNPSLPDNNIAVNIIDAPDYNAQYQCTFYTPGEKALVGGITPEGLSQVIIGPPQPVTGVSCAGICIPTYSDCFRNGQYLGPCCNGFCAANKCRPWIQPS